jgi:hypothetical protein
MDQAGNYPTLEKKQKRSDIRSFETGAPGAIRTRDPLLRKQVL